MRARVRKLEKEISIHAPAWGATSAATSVYTDISDFNPRSRVGSDLQEIGELLERKKFQSTLPRGERQPQASTPHRQAKFQSTLPRGERHVVQVGTSNALEFQSTLPRGERPIKAAYEDGVSKFQSTLPRGERRPERQGRIDLAGISIHAPAWGATDWAMANGYIDNISIHAPAWGAT